MAPVVWLLEASRGAHAAELVELIEVAAGQLGLAAAGLWLADVQQRRLVRYPSTGGDGGDEVTVDGSVAGRAYRDATLQRSDGGGGAAGTVWLPLIDGGERVGVLSGSVEDWSEQRATELLTLAQVSGRLLSADQRYTDAVVRARRLRSASVPAEVQWALLPPLSCVTGSAEIAGVLEPAYDIGGDSFDYAVDEVRAQVAVFDAMGHGLSATLMVSVAVGAYRQARRGGLDLSGCYANIDRAVSDQFGPDRFVTGVLAEIDLASGEVSYLVAGHHPAVLLRSGRVVRHLGDAALFPFGLGAGLGPMPGLSGADGSVGLERLEPGDRLLLYTDGVVEARDPSGAFFGLDRLEELLVREDASGSNAAETLRRLIHAVLDHQQHELQDDATLLMLQWAHQ